MKAYTTEFFIERAKNVYADKYDYSNTKYVNTETPITITCPTHGEFKLRPLKFLKGRECPNCRTAKNNNTYRLTTEQFIEKSKLVHGNKYDYSKSIYINQKTKVTVICPKHGKFEIVPNYHLVDKCGCKLCGKESIKKKTSYGANKFIIEANKVHKNKYNYNDLNFVDMRTITSFSCPIHGEFLQTPSLHIRTGGCQKCGIEKVASQKRYTKSYFIKKSKKIHLDKFDYSQVIYENAFKKVTIICKKHGEFKQKPAMHMQGQGCPSCVNSQGERQISCLLKQHNIIFECEKKFKYCKNIRQLPFDFFIPHLNICIEFQGIQHYDAYHRMGGESAFKKLQINDQIKRNFCNLNNITLLEIKYDESIEEKLREYNII